LREHQSLEVVQLIVAEQRAVEFGRESFEGLLRPEPKRAVAPGGPDECLTVPQGIKHNPHHRRNGQPQQ
jgi:hypothetical protein